MTVRAREARLYLLIGLLMLAGPGNDQRADAVRAACRLPVVAGGLRANGSGRIRRHLHTDGGIARAPQTGVYGEEREWLIEGWGVEPDIVVDNLPHETFNGRDRQLETAVEFLQRLIREDPRDVPAPPPYPDKSFTYPEPTGGGG